MTEIPTIDFTPKAAIFDIDDTLLDNRTDEPGQGLHERSRLAAAHEVGRRHNIPALTNYSATDNANAFLEAPVHTLEAAIWQTLLMTGIADSTVINYDHPLLKEMAVLKNELHKDILLQEGEEVPGAISFVRNLVDANGLEDKLAIASTAVRRDIYLFLEKTGLGVFFPEGRIISKESVTRAKPHPESYNQAFASFSLPESDRRVVCAFEDDPRGIMAAKGAGLFVCAITTRFSRDSLRALEVPPDIVADSFAEFSELFGLPAPTMRDYIR